MSRMSLYRPASATARARRRSATRAADAIAKLNGIKAREANFDTTGDLFAIQPVGIEIV
jgi:hypothetical protein